MRRVQTENRVSDIVIFGAGGIGRRLHDILLMQGNVNITAFFDNDDKKHGTSYSGTPILPPEMLRNFDYDYLYYGTQMGVDEIGLQLEILNVPYSKIRRDYVDTITNARRLFVDRFAEQAKSRRLSGAVAEAGVYRGEFARHISARFPQSKIYLFDTFAGFDSKDFQFEEDESLLAADHFKKTSVDHVIGRMPHPEMCIIKQGYFPDSLAGLEDKFVFVSLDMDLYKPTLSALHYFYERMVRHGCILIHDYFTPSYPNVKKAVADFERVSGSGLCILPIGDDVSAAVVKF